MKHLLDFKKIVALTIAIMVSISAQSQLLLFDSTSRSEIGFDSLQSNKLDSMISNPIYLNHYFVEVNELYNIQDSGSIYVNIPGKSGYERFDGIEIQYLNNGDYTYYGELDTCDELRGGNIHILSKNGNVFGQINIEDEIYELQDFGNHKNVLFAIDPSIYTENECGNDTISSFNRNFKMQNRSNHGCEVRVLFLFTDRASWNGNPENSAELFIAQTNQIAGNSEANVWFSVAGVQHIENFTENIQPLITLNEITNSPVANDFRNQFQADIVVLLTDGNWTIPGGLIIGISNLERWGDPDFAYALVEIDAGGGMYTCSHEIGHTFGCKHENDNRGAPNFIFEARGHEFKTGPFFWRTNRTTVMRTGGENRIMHFSNPDVNYKNKATGVENERNNASQLADMGCTISEYRDFIDTLKVQISGPSRGNNSGTYTWCANITGCSNPLSIVWEYSLDGFNYYPWSTSNGNCITSNLPFGQSIWFRVTVDCGGGQIATDWHHTVNTSRFNNCNSTPELGTNPNEDNKTALTKGNILSVFPNPTSGELIIRFYIDEVANVDIKLLDLSGREVCQLSKGQRQIGTHTESYNIANYSNGFYIMSALIGNKIITKSVFKQ